MSIFFRRSKGDSAPMIYGEGLGFLMRGLLLMGIFAICGVAFWYNFEYRFKQIEARTTFGDATNLVSKQEKAEVMASVYRFEDDWGVDILIQIRSDVVHAPTAKSNRLFIGFVPKRGQSLLLLPPLLKRAIPAEDLRFITTALDICVIENEPSDCLKRVIASLDEVLRN